MTIDEPTEELPDIPFSRGERTLAWLLARLDHTEPVATPDELSEARRLPDAELLALAAALGIDGKIGRAHV